jgi:hypothetical protein
LWRERFAGLVESLLDQPARQEREQLEIKPRLPGRTTSAGGRMTLVPVQVINRGRLAALAKGPARVVLRCCVQDGAGEVRPLEGPVTPLPALLMPERALVVAVPVPVPAEPGTYQVTFSATRRQGPALPDLGLGGSEPLDLMVTRTAQKTSDDCCTLLLQTVHNALAEAHGLQRLPDDYTDITQGRWAVVKAWIKRKLLGNFKHAYVDVLSRQQSAFNERMLLALNELAECCATLDSAGRWTRSDHKTPDMNRSSAFVEPRLEAGENVALVSVLEELWEQLAQSTHRIRALEERIACLEEKAAIKGRTKKDKV